MTNPSTITYDFDEKTILRKLDIPQKYKKYSIKSITKNTDGKIQFILEKTNAK